jgi:hypothetical protein
MWFLLGLMIGVPLGITLGALLACGGRSDECEECIRLHHEAWEAGRRETDCSLPALPQWLIGGHSRH